jgi:histidine triad (HIT) family protein
MQEPSVFTRILNGEIPGEIIYKDDQCFVLMTIEPTTPGHALVIPIQQVETVWDADQPLYHHLMDVAKKVSAAIDKAYDYQRIVLMAVGLDVDHAHLHVYGVSGSIYDVIAQRAANKSTTPEEELKIEADKLRACL